jgi:hypothetical protein
MSLDLMDVRMEKTMLKRVWGLPYYAAAPVWDGETKKGWHCLAGARMRFAGGKGKGFKQREAKRRSLKGMNVNLKMENACWT